MRAQWIPTLLLLLVSVAVLPIACATPSFKLMTDAPSTPEVTQDAFATRDTSKRLANEWLTDTLPAPKQLHHGRVVTEVAFAPDGATLAAIDRSGTVKLWDWRTGEELMSWTAHPAGYYGSGVDISPSGEQLASCGTEGAVITWDISTAAEIMHLEGCKRGSGTVRYSPDGTMLATASAAQTAMLWGADSGELITTVPVAANSVEFSPNGAVLAIADTGGILRLMDMESMEVINEFRAHNGRIWGLSFSPDGEVLATGSYHAAKVWNVNTGTEMWSADLPPNSAIEDVAFSPDGSVLVSSAYQDPTLRIWDSQSGEEIGRFDAPHRHMFFIGIEFSPDGHTLAVGSNDGNVHVWEELIQ